MKPAKIKLVPGWRKCWRWLSVQIPLLNLAFVTVWAQLPPELKSEIPQKWMWFITAALIIIGVLGRMIDQGTKNADDATR